MKFNLVISIVVTAFVIKIQAQDNFIKFPLTDCDPKQVSEDVEIKFIEANNTFTDEKKSYGPYKCAYQLKTTFTAKDPEKLMNYLELDGIQILNTKFCNGEKGFAIQPPCKKGQSQQYVLSGMFPKELNQKLGDVIAKLGFKGEDGKTLVCKQETSYFFKSSCCN